MLCEELDSLGPQAWDTLRRVVQIDSETVGFVVVLHITEDIVIYIAEEVNLGFNSPVVLSMLQSRMLVKQATVPPAHLMVGFHCAILNVIFLEDFGRLLEDLFVDPRWDFPMFLWN
jgi:hypothetical protein